MSPGEEGEHVRAKNASSPGGQAWGFPPLESMLPGWSTAGLCKSLRPLPRQEAQPGPSQPCSLTVHTDGAQRSDFPAVEKQTRGRGGELGARWGFSSSLYFFSVGSKGNTDAQPTCWRDRVGARQRGAPHRFLCVSLPGGRAGPVWRGDGCSEHLAPRRGHLQGPELEPE